MIEILKIALKWKKQILIFCAIAVIASVIITMPFIMPPYFQSKMIFYLSNPESTDRAALFNEKEVGGVSMFGGKEDVNRFLTIINSAPITLSVIRKYDLGHHYNVKAASPELFMYYTSKKFYGNFNAVRNDLGAIEVSAIDTDNKLACAIVKELVAQSDSIYRSMLIENKSTVLNLIDQQIKDKKAAEQASPSSAALDELQKLMSIRDQYAVSSSKEFKTLYVVEEPMPEVKKVKPIRWLIVLATAVASLLLASFAALVIELYKHADKYGFQRS